MNLRNSIYPLTNNCNIKIIIFLKKLPIRRLPDNFDMKSLCEEDIEKEKWYFKKISQKGNSIAPEKQRNCVKI